MKIQIERRSMSATRLVQVDRAIEILEALREEADDRLSIDDEDE
jgi:hypothetical protein